MAWDLWPRVLDTWMMRGAVNWSSPGAELDQIVGKMADRHDEPKHNTFGRGPFLEIISCLWQNFSYSQTCNPKWPLFCAFMWLCKAMPKRLLVSVMVVTTKPSGGHQREREPPGWSRRLSSLKGLRKQLTGTGGLSEMWLWQLQKQKLVCGGSLVRPWKMTFGQPENGFGQPSGHSRGGRRALSMGFIAGMECCWPQIGKKSSGGRSTSRTFLGRSRVVRIV